MMNVEQKTGGRQRMPMRQDDSTPTRQDMNTTCIAVCPFDDLKLVVPPSSFLFTQPILVTHIYIDIAKQPFLSVGLSNMLTMNSLRLPCLISLVNYSHNVVAPFNQ